MGNYLPDKFMVSGESIEYEEQGPSHCGAFSVKAVLNSMGEYRQVQPKYLHTNFFCKLTGTTLGKNYYVNILKIHGVQSSFKVVPKKEINKLKILKELLATNNPVMVRIGNGYLPNGKYSRILSNIVGHWITLWGFDDNEGFFYVYDSAVRKPHYDRGLPIGNVKRTYENMLRDWSRFPITTIFNGTIPPFSLIEIRRK